MATHSNILPWNTGQRSLTGCSPLGSYLHGIFQTRILEWVAISSSRGSSPPRDQIHISCIGRWILYHWATWEALHWSLQVSCLSHFVFCCDFEVTSFIYPYTQPILGLKRLIMKFMQIKMYLFYLQETEKEATWRPLGNICNSTDKKSRWFQQH